MSKAAVIYRSRTGVTRRLAAEIAEHLERRGIQAVVQSVGDCDPATLEAYDFVFLGCWTNGLFVVSQHPDQPWLDFVRHMPRLHEPRIALFTTYKLVTGSMFPKMRERLRGKAKEPELELKSRDGHLTPKMEDAIERFIL